jgi:competence protein ComEC
MVAVVAAALWSGRTVSSARTLALALGVVLVADPWAPLAPGFWLSFGAVALIFYVAHGWSAPGAGLAPRLYDWLRVQWAITVGLAPASVLLFSQISLVGPLANALAIPLVSIVITPLALAAALVPFDAPLHWAAWLVDALLAFLRWCAALPIAVFERPAPPLWAMLAALAGALWLLAPRGLPWRASGFALMLPAFMLRAPAPPAGEAWITVLDVGQGLAVLVRTAHRALLYDTGPAFGAGDDSGARVILPLLRAEGVARLDAMILTHADADHVGGARSLLDALEVGELRTSLAAGHPLLARRERAERCARGTAWQWDGVRFELLHPAAGDYAALGKGNNLSCVLRVSAGGRSVLLTGDMERGAEALLAERSARELHADVLLVPHHGSRTSSTAALLDAVAPRWALVPVGYRNRFRHPNGEVMERYRARGIALLRTDLDGALTVRLGARGVALEAERERAAHYWRDRRDALAL